MLWYICATIMEPWQGKIRDTSNLHFTDITVLPDNFIFQAPGPNARIVYIDGAFDLFHAGHVEV